ncbi:hypothetical protein [Aquimarina sp. 2201CG5-10]|uniref:hypothetical protein n=1 Tax=Aquimarina callyspongiae TaxID=3098150 RepID=UPI002AB5D5C6|nr:hypothetical protein [Aquimarina sp. 2201CG5-10]MDY8135731.1 hypothetical protein [Aquimarina sp. 2201CG5-10]
MKTKLLKPIYLLVMLLLLGACSNPEDEFTDISSEIKIPEVINGRLVFSNKEQMEKLMTDKTILKSFEKELDKEQFTQLKKLPEAINYEYPDFVLNFYNVDGEIQMGEDIIIIKGLTQYIIKDNNEILFEQVKSDLENGIKPEYKGVFTHNIEHIVPVEENQDRYNWLDARYQHEFPNSGGGYYKYVFEAYLNAFYFWGTVNIQTGVRAKLEWLHGNTWKPAADIVYKSISNLTIKVTPSYGNAQVKNVSFISQTNNQNLVVTGPTNLNSLIGPMNYYLEISGKFHAEMDDPRQTSNYPWTKTCNWQASFTL